MTEETKKINRRVYLRVTNRCNKNCSFCLYNGDPKLPGDMTLDTIKTIISNESAIHEHGRFLRIELTGGEPTLHSELSDIINYLTNLDSTVVVLETNGTNLNTAAFLSIAEAFKNKRNLLKISFNSALIDSDQNWLAQLLEFINYANTVGIRYVLNIRFKDEADKNRLQNIIAEHSIKQSYDEFIYHPIYNGTLYKDGKIENPSLSWVLYDYDGELLFEANKINKNNLD